jgi:integrase
MEMAMTKIKLDTPTGRAKLRARPEPYFYAIDKGKHVGYRAGADTWVARRTRPGGKKVYEALGTFRPESEAFTKAKAAAEAWFATLADGAVAHYSVEKLIADYVEDRRIENGEASAREAEQLLNKHVLSKFAGRDVASITTAELNRWRKSFVPRALKGDKDDLTEDQRREKLEELQRRAKDTSNRNWNTFRAALTHAFRDGKVASDTAWRRVEPFEDVGRERQFYPTPEQVADLLKHCDDALRPLARAAALTGFRLQALTGALVSDFDPKAGTLNIRRDKDHERDATLSSAAVELFKQQAKDKLPSAYLFVRADGLPWGKSHQHRPFRDAVARANADPDVKAKLPREFIFYSLRHYFISRALLAGMNVNALAKNVGTSAAMIEKHYGKFIRSDVRDMLDRVAVA